MVDVAEGFGAKASAARPLARTTSAHVHVTVTAATGSALAGYRALAKAGVEAPPQGIAWIEHWIDTVKPDAILAILSKDGETVMALALEVERGGPFTVARFMSGTHANGNFALARSTWLPHASADDVNALVAGIARARPDVDMIALERLLPDFDGLTNPLLVLPHTKSPNVSLACGLDGGFEALLARSSGKRKRKKHRSQSRKFEAAGGYRRIEANTPDEVNRLLDAFFAMKDIRFRKAGIHNVFGEPSVQSFFRRLFIGALSAVPRDFALHGLEVGGRLRAVTGSSRRGNTMICEFGAIVEDELANASPGDFLFFENIREACGNGSAVYDFSVGDELYKRLWCDLETQHMDALVPLTAKGRLLALQMRLRARAKAFIKNSPLVWKITKALRRRAAGQAVAAREPADD